MKPSLTLWNGVSISSYALFVLLGVLLATWVRRAERKRLVQLHDPRMHWINAAALLGAIAGSKLGMLLFETPEPSPHAFDLTGKTVVGGLAGGYLAVELCKLALGFRASTGDAWAVALPLAQGFGRIGCLLHGCCYGSETNLPWGVSMLGATRHPVALYEAAGDLTIAAVLYTMRERSAPAGRLFKLYLLSYAVLRFVLEPLRGDGAIQVGALSVVQWVCLLAALGLSVSLWHQRSMLPREARI